jgi:hypothetical protein
MPENKTERYNSPLPDTADLIPFSLHYSAGAWPPQRGR